MRYEQNFIVFSRIEYTSFFDFNYRVPFLMRYGEAQAGQSAHELKLVTKRDGKVEIISLACAGSSTNIFRDQCERIYWLLAVLFQVYRQFPLLATVAMLDTVYFQLVYHLQKYPTMTLELNDESTCTEIQYVFNKRTHYTLRRFRAHRNPLQNS